MADTPVSAMSAAILGANNPAQSTSTQKGFYEAPNALFRAMNQQSVTNLQSLASGSLGTFLQQKRIVGGDVATIINATLSYVLGGQNQGLPAIPGTVKFSSTKRTFIPIIIKTDFTFFLNGINNTNNKSNSEPVPLYIVFDSTPEDITFQKTANWVPQNFLGRPEPVWTYQNSSATTFSLIGKFYAESFEAHGRLLKLSDYIMALVTPSESNYMPSPVTVFIGQWKELRCIVNNVTVKYSGPWRIQVGSDDIENVSQNGGSSNEASVLANAMAQQASSIKVPSHAPYLFEATFNFTVVGKDNEVSYAEQIVSTGSNNSGVSLTDSDAEKAALTNIFGATYKERTSTINNGLYSIKTSNTYTFTSGQIETYTDSSLQYSEAGKNINIYANANAVNRLSDQGVISNAINSKMLSLFQKKNPTSTNTPATTSSLNPFKKLF